MKKEKTKVYWPGKWGLGGGVQELVGPGGVGADIGGRVDGLMPVDSLRTIQKGALSRKNRQDGTIGFGSLRRGAGKGGGVNKGFSNT